ncbi:MAG: HlyD family secretion protein [Sphingobacteriaceae bacterium]
MAKSANKKSKKKIFPFIMGGIVLILLLVGVTKFQYALHHEETDDAQVEGNISPIAPRLSGYIQDIRVVENQAVKAGDTLIILDNRDLLVRVAQAEAGLENAKAALLVAQANTRSSRSTVASSGANIETARVKVWQANQDFKRYSNLIKDGSITQQQFDAAKAAKDVAEAQLKLAIRQQETSTTGTDAVSNQIAVAEAQVKLRQSELDFANLQLSYATITAPASGFIAKKSIQVGQLVQAGQALCAIVKDNQVWVTANFKETQIGKMKVGQSAVVKADAFPGKEFKGEIESFAPATGAKFSLLPPDNASGNFVKVVQRIPVRIRLNNDPELQNLRSGMNVKAIINLK